jgi:hypothetical protein
MSERGPTVETAPVRRAGTREPLLVGLAFMAMIVVLVKPWGDPSSQTPEPRPRSSPIAAAPTPVPLVRTPVVLPAGTFKPSAGTCYHESSWYVCLLDEAGGQQIQGWLSGRRDTSPEPSAPAAPAIPSVLLLTREGGGLGFYPSDAERERAGEAIVVAAWRVDELTTGTRSLTLEPVGPLRMGDAVAHNVFIPPMAQPTAGGWPAGRYVFRFQAAAGAWEQFFAIDVAVEEPAPSCSAALSVPGPAAGTGASPPAAACPEPG